MYTFDSSGCLLHSTNAPLQSLNIPGLKIGFQMSRVLFSTSFPYSSHLVPKLDLLREILHLPCMKAV